MLRRLGFQKRTDNAFGDIGLVKHREDTLILPYSTRKRSLSEISSAPIHLLSISLHDPIAYRITFKVCEDAVNPWFTVIDFDNKIHKDNAKIQEKLQDKNAKKVLKQAAIYNEIFGRSFVTRKGKDKKEKWFGISDLDLDNVDADVFDEHGEKQPINVKYHFQQLNTKGKFDPTLVKPDDYIFQRSRPVGLTSKGVSIVVVCYDDLHYLYNIRRDMAERMRKYAGFAHAKIEGGTTSLIEAYKAQYGDLNRLDEIWSNEKLSLEMKGMEGIALNPDYYYKPFIEQISIATGIPSPILRGMESGQLKSGQVNLSSYYSVMSNIQAGMDDTAEQMVEWVKPGIMKKSKIRWNMEFAISEVDREAINEIRVTNAVALQPYITDKAFAELLSQLGIKEEDILSEEERMKNNPFMNQEGSDDDGEGKPNSPFEGNMNPIKEEQGRETALKKNPKVRSET